MEGKPHCKKRQCVVVCVLGRSLLVEGGGGRSGALSRLAGGMERARRRRGGRFKAQRGQMVRGGVLGEGGRRWDEENRWSISLGQKKGYPFLPERREGVRGMSKGLRMVKFGSEKEQVKETHFFSQLGERLFVGVMGLWGGECESIGIVTLGTLTESPTDGHRT